MGTAKKGGNGMNIKYAIEVLKYLSKSIKIGGGKSLIYTRDAEAIDTVVAELEKTTYTADDIFDFIKWGFTKPGYMRNYFNYFRGDTKGFFTPSELLKKWEDCKSQQRKEEQK